MAYYDTNTFKNLSGEKLILICQSIPNAIEDTQFIVPTEK